MYNTRVPDYERDTKAHVWQDYLMRAQVRSWGDSYSFYDRYESSAGLMLPNTFTTVLTSSLINYQAPVIVLAQMIVDYVFTPTHTRETGTPIYAQLLKNGGAVRDFTAIPPSVGNGMPNMSYVDESPKNAVYSLVAKSAVTGTHSASYVLSYAFMTVKAL